MIKILLIGFCLLPFMPAHAAEIYIMREKAEEGVLQHVVLDTDGESLNAFEGRIIISDGRVRDGNSIVSLWVEKPRFHNGTVRFSGITPGGYNGSEGLLFTVVAETEGTLQEAFAYRSDGTGERVPIRLGKVREIPAQGAEDVVPPESFIPVIASDEDAFGGKKMLIFAAHDKGKGVDYYEVCEGLLASCVRTESPYELQHQRFGTLLRVRAVDASGNVRTQYLSTPAVKIRYALMLCLGILLCMSAVYAVKRRKRLDS